ncbi:hypothetical protein LQ327_22660 [Actinomycetospora endophytica]|uniref:Winged helix DNA-binding protein n=1 Tax=Actinomycetospora endophytica TaxID=2291215 RepID=A0ABS8PGR0_9PSEU|nr:hypothetical protein [Actinomycetospora endophytica]MCD2196179.1 hypothetical protein [Actinomycetospora endophytica]
MFTSGISNRDRAVLLAVARGRVTATGTTTLAVDGLPIADQFAVGGLLRSQLISVRQGDLTEPVVLTELGRSALSIPA